MLQKISRSHPPKKSCEGSLYTPLQQKAHKPPEFTTRHYSTPTSTGTSGGSEEPSDSHKCIQEVKPHPATMVSRLTGIGRLSLTISCCEAWALLQRSSGRCSSFSGGCSTHGPGGDLQSQSVTKRGHKCRLKPERRTSVHAERWNTHRVDMNPRKHSSKSLLVK